MALLPRGNFSFITDNDERQMLRSAFTAIESVPGGWNALLPEPEAGRGFMFQSVISGSVMYQINQAIDANYGGHSGSSYGWTMRQMQGIARLGWEQYVQLRLNAAAMPPPLPMAAVAAAAPGGGGVPILLEPATTLYDGVPCVCPICYENHDDTALAVNDGTGNNPITCGHTFHQACILDWTRLGRRSCPVCRGNIASLSRVLHIPSPLEALPVLPPPPPPVLPSPPPRQNWCTRLFRKPGGKKTRKQKMKKVKKSHRRKTRR
jgi:hypothetical protein